MWGANVTKGVNHMLNQQELTGNWREIKGKLKQRWGALTDDELSSAEGNVERLIGLIQRKTGEARSAIEEFLDEVSAEGGSMAQKVADNARVYAQAAGEQVSRAYEGVSESVREGYEQAEGYVQRNPMQSMAFAFGAGVLTGVIVGIVLRSR
jgi:uncharacterized protein YjbJ (UPF0337 family)